MRKEGLTGVHVSKPSVGKVNWSGELILNPEGGNSSRIGHFTSSPNTR